MSIYNKNVCSNNGFARDFSKGKSFDFSEWNPVKTYVNDSFKQDFVTYAGNIYVCIHTNTNVVPGSSECWMLALERLSGTTFVPVIDDEGNLSWQIYTGTETPGTFNIKGEDGKQGLDGKSAYEIWLNKGNSGSEDDFLDAYRGVQGEPGEIGPQGPKGEAGKDGASVTIVGVLFSTSDLNGVSSNPGDGYLIDTNLWVRQEKEPDTSLEYIYDSDNDIYWLNVGEIKGPKGEQGDKGERGEQGLPGVDGKDAPIPTFNINSNGHLILTLEGVESDLGKVVGNDGNNESYKSPTFKIEGENLFVSYDDEWIDLGKVKGEDGVIGKDGEPGLQGEPGPKGDPGSVVTIGENNNWFIDGEDTGVSAIGKDGIIGHDGVGITSITSSENTGIAGKTDIYTINLSNDTSYSFNVTNGSDGNHILFGNGEPENITSINDNLEYIFNPCGYIPEENISKIVANKGDVYINLLSGNVFEYTAEWELKGSIQGSNNSDDVNLTWEDIGF